jgi:simple sugar transport system ATP-binding protein
MALSSPEGSRPPAIELLGIDKRFGAVHANRAVSMRVPRGSVTGIVGENGAGKSTLMSILYGFYRADAGEIRIDGRPVEIASSQDAIAAGIGMVHQHFMLVETFSVLENVMLGAEGGAMLAVGAEATRAELARLDREYGLRVDPDAIVGDLPVGDQQRVEILKALCRGAEILILDEPTGVLTPQETDQLFRILATLRARGTTILLITHKLREIMAATDLVFVMRGGAVVAERKTAETTAEELAELMVGRKVRFAVEKSARAGGEALLVARDLTVVDERGVKTLDQASFELRAGEIVGVAGVSGNGQSELLEVLSGIRAPTSGTLRLLGREVDAARPCGPDAMRALGLAHVPEDRHRLGMVGAFAAAESAILGYQRDPAYCGAVAIDNAEVARRAGLLMERFDVRPRAPGLRSAAFSGGNQQKLILARELAREPRIVLAGQPTRGLDIGAIEFVHRRLIERRDAGAAVLLVSAELDEILSLSDRILVMFEGRIVGELPAAEADERKLGLLMANVRPEIAA